MMRKMTKEGFFKKVVSAVSAASLMAVMLTGCGGSSDSTAGTGSADNAADKVYKIGVTQISDHPSLDNCREGFILSSISQNNVLICRAVSSSLIGSVNM